MCRGLRNALWRHEWGLVAFWATCTKPIFSKWRTGLTATSEIIPINTIQKPPSAELRPDQKDSDSLPDYDILDQNFIRLH